MIRIAQSANPLDARLLLGVLEAHGIRACIHGEALWAARGELPLTPESAPSVWVTDEADAQRARQILSEHAAPPNPSHYRKCGQDLRGQREPQCPKCGTPFRIVGSWTCPDCKELIGTQFSHCWKCGTERGDAAETPTAQGTKGQAPTPCAQCGGAGQIERRLFPAALIAAAAVLAFAALRDLMALAPLADFQVDLLLGRVLYAAVAILCIYFARRVWRTPCECTKPSSAEVE